MSLVTIEASLLVAAYFRGGNHDDGVWTSNCDQVVTLSLFYTGDVSADECKRRFSQRCYVGGLYNEAGELCPTIEIRYQALIIFINRNPELIEGGGNLKTPADPTYTSCRLTKAGMDLAISSMAAFPSKPDFPNWPDRRSNPDM
jgi:hypothetical protein